MKVCLRSLSVLAAVAMLVGSGGSRAGTRAEQHSSALPTWKSVYDWSWGSGYAGWHSTTTSPADYGMQAALGGQPGLWLWPLGGHKTYATSQYAEWAYTAPGTTRLQNVTLSYAWNDKLFADHCIDVGLRNASGTVITRSVVCNPPRQSPVTLTLADPSSNPSSTVLYFRIRVDCGSASSCSKTIPSKDPLKNGAFARLLKADMTLVDDDDPVIQPSGPLWDVRDHFIDGTATYGVTLGATDAGSGIVGSSFVSKSPSHSIHILGVRIAPCDLLHRTSSLDARICPATFSWDTRVPAPPYPEGPNTFTEGALDVAGNTGSLSWTIYIDRTPPAWVIASGDFWDRNGTYIDGTQSYGLNLEAVDPGRETQKASGIDRVWLTRDGDGEAASSSAPCTALICPDTYLGSMSVDTSSFPEGANAFTAHASDLVGHVIDGSQMTLYVDRTAPTPATDLAVWSYDSGQATIGWTPGDDPDLADGTPGSGFASYQYRFQVNGGGFSDWASTDSSDGSATPSFATAASVGDVIDVEVREFDAVGNQSDVASASLTVVGDESIGGLAPGPVAPDFANTPTPFSPPPDQPLQPVTSDDSFDPASADVPDDGGLTPLDSGSFFGLRLPHAVAGAGGAAPKPDRRSPRAPAAADASAAFTTSGPCQLGPETAIASGSKDGVGFTEYPSCVVFTNDVGSWTIYKVCKEEAAADRSQRRGVGPGYIATLVTVGGSHLVDDFRARDASVDAKIDNPGNLGATHGGLGTFEVQYVRGQPGATVGSNFGNVEGALTVVDPVTGAQFPLTGTGVRPTWGMLNGRMCADSQGEGVYDVTTYTAAPAKGATHSIDYEMDVWIRERSDVATGYGPLAGSSSQHPGDTHALFEVSYYYRFYPSEVGSLIVVRSFRQDQGGVPMVKEPKIATELRANGRFTEIDVLRPNRTVATAATRGQPEAPNAILYTRQADDPSRVVARWGVSAPNQADRCPGGCFSTSLRAIRIARNLPPAKNPFTSVADPLADYSRPLWQNGAYGLDGWASRSAGRDKAYPRDTTSDDKVTSCSADYPTNVLDAQGHLVHHAGDPIYLRPYYHHLPPFTDAEKSRVSAFARTSMPDARRWELGGWKPDATGGGDHPDDPFSASFVLFNGWEGARGPNDCEPLEVALAPGVESYGMVARYTLGGPFALFGGQPTK